MAELRKRAEALGIVFSGEDAEAATKFGDTLDDLGKQLMAVTFQVGAAVANALQPFAEGAINILTNVIAWARENRALVVGILAAAAGLVTLGAALVGVGVAIQLVGVALTFAAIGAIVGLVTN